nr:hypothetical protein L203_03612 [Cryptococcus depauperatus CBS 7841]
MSNVTDNEENLSRGMNDEKEVDTDTKLALLTSLLHPLVFSKNQYLEALSFTSGQVDKAAEQLLLPNENGPSKKRKFESLKGWLGQSSEAGKKNERKKLQAESTIVNRPRVKAMELAIESDRTYASGNATDKDNSLSRVLDGQFHAKADKKRAVPQSAISLSTQSSINAHNLPLTLIASPLTPSMASALYLTMMEESKEWKTNRFYIAGNAAESPHKIGFYMREGGGYGGSGARYFYAGAEQGKAKVYPSLLRDAADIVQKIVNIELSKRQRYPLEWAGEWEANVCGTNRYDGAKSSVGWHADQLTYLGPYTTIASLSLGTARSFRLRETQALDPTFASKQPPRTYEVTLRHNSLCLMNAGCQERFKHTVPAQKAIDVFKPGYDVNEKSIPSDKQISCFSRINITFRFYRKGEYISVSQLLAHLDLEKAYPCANAAFQLDVLRADQKAKARSRLASAPSLSKPFPIDRDLVDDDMVFFWQCQSPTQTGEENGCGFFRLLDMRKEGRGPCIHY